MPTIRGNKDLHEQFIVLKKCRKKFECLFEEMFFYPKKKPKLNAQSDSFKEKIFSTQLILSTFHIVEILTRCKETLTRFPSIKKSHRNLTFRIWKMMNESLERHFNWFSLIFILDTLFYYRAKNWSSFCLIMLPAWSTALLCYCSYIYLCILLLHFPCLLCIYNFL